MNTRLRLAIVLAAVSGVLFATAGAFAYATSTTQQANQQACGSMMNHTGGMGMMGGMNHYGSMTPEECRSMMGQQNMGQCQGFMAQSQNSTRACY